MVGCCPEEGVMLVLIDNYDSFTWNLVHYFGQLGPEVRVFRNDEITPEGVLALNPAGVVLSPGPCDPDRAGICLDMIGLAAEKAVPLFGVCLGHQAIGQAFGGQVRSEEHTSELQSLMRLSYAVFCLQKKNTTIDHTYNEANH